MKRTLKWLTLPVFILCLLFPYTGYVFAGESTYVFTRNIDMAMENFNDVAFGKDLYVAVGNKGTIKYSRDGLKWENSNLIINDDLFSIVFNGSAFIISGDNGIILSSNDGISWTKRYAGTSCSLKKVLWNGSKFYTCGYSSSFGYSQVLSSADGIRWDILDTRTTPTYHDMAYNGTTFVAVGIRSSIMVSTDGLNWTKSDLDTNQCFNSIDSNGKIFVANEDRGAICISKDGINWKRLEVVEENDYLWYVNWTGNHFIASTGQKSYVSEDGINWDIKRFGDSRDDSKAVAVNGSQMCIVTISGELIFLNGTESIPYYKYYNYFTSYRKIVHNGDRFVILGDNGSYASFTLTSTDGQSWSRNYFSQYYDLNDIIWDGSRFIIVGPTGMTMVSNDGVEWKSMPSGVNDSFTSIIYENGLYFACSGQGGIYSSPDLISWTERNAPFILPSEFPLPGLTLTNIVSNGSTFVAVGRSGCMSDTEIYSSKDGLEWEEEYMPYLRGEGPINNIIWDGHLFICSYRSGSLLTSADGHTWEAPTPKAGVSYIIWTGKEYIGISNSSICTSIDLVNWTRYPIELNNRLDHLTYVDGKLYIVGEYGTILTGIKQENQEKLFKISGTIATRINSDLKFNINSRIELISDKYCKSVSCASDGSFVFEGVPELTSGFSIKISSVNCITKTLKYDVLNSDKIISTKDAPVLVTLGDLTIDYAQDGAINMGDIMELAKSFNSKRGDERYQYYKDFNDDNAINFADIMIIAQNFNKSE